jgi:hypothetical protein
MSLGQRGALNVEKSEDEPQCASYYYFATSMVGAKFKEKRPTCSKVTHLFNLHSKRIATWLLMPPP